MQTEISGWAYTQATREMTCPRCHAEPGESCRTPKGRRANTHGERLNVYVAKIGREEFMRRHSRKSITYKELLERLKR